VSSPANAIAAVNSSFSASPANPNPQPCMARVLTATIVEVTFQTPIQTARAKAAVTAPHWSTALAATINDGAGSTHPTTYLIRTRGATGVSVTVRVTASQNITDATGTLTGTLGGITITGTCPTGVGDHVVAATIQQLPDRVARVRGDIPWTFQVASFGTVNLGSTRVEVYFVLDTPGAVYTPTGGVWVEALRFCCQSANVLRLQLKKAVAANITTYCHGGHGLHYDTAAGRPYFGTNGTGAGTFQLMDYMNAMLGQYVNCYDQASAIQVLAAAFGVVTTRLYMAPFGFINTTILVSAIQCNNPFYSSNGSAPVCGVNDPLRTGFGNHAFCEYWDATNADVGQPAPALLPDALVADACAGPHTATENKAAYVTASIDSVNRPAAAGTVANMTEYPGVTSIA
jgi:hypothetical protein